MLVTGDAIRPGLPFLLTFTSRHLAAEMAREDQHDDDGNLIGDDKAERPTRECEDALHGRIGGFPPETQANTGVAKRGD